MHWKGVDYIPLKRFGNWRAKLNLKESVSAGKLLYRNREDRGCCDLLGQCDEDAVPVATRRGLFVLSDAIAIDIVELG